MSDTANTAKLIDRVQKLLALANNNPSQAEAAAAAAKVQAILAQHNIDMTQVEQDTPTAHEQREKTPHDRSAMYKWQQDLMRQLAANNFCMYFLRKMQAESFGKMRTVKRHVLLGRKVNMASTMMAYDYLVDTADRLLPYEGMQKRGKDALAWLDGFTSAVVTRLEERREQSLAESRAAHQAQPRAASGGTALVLAEVYSSEEDLNNDALYGWEPGTTARRKAEGQARAAARKAELEAAERRLVEEEGYSVEDAWYVARGYPVPDQIKLAGEALGQAAETEAQRRKRQEREAREGERYREQQGRRYRKEALRVSNPVFQAGKAEGQKVGLDVQVGHSPTKAIG